VLDNLTPLQLLLKSCKRLLRQEINGAQKKEFQFLKFQFGSMEVLETDLMCSKLSLWELISCGSVDQFYGLFLAKDKQVLKT
jgi:hypothetical protein